MLAGEVDSRTDDEKLWLRSSAKTFVLTTSASWTNIAVSNVGRKQLTANELKELAAKIKTRVPKNHGLYDVRDNTSTHVVQQQIDSNATTQVQSIKVEAHIANWDRDAESDGIELRISPQNAFGKVVPVSGQLLVQLVGRNRLPVRNQDAFPQLGRWSLRTNISDFDFRGAIYRLPYNKSKPPTDQTLETLGVVEAQLMVFGHGRYEADAPIYIRRFNPVRDDLQRQRRVLNR